jgi:hypothetical protein
MVNSSLSFLQVTRLFGSALYLTWFGLCILLVVIFFSISTYLQLKKIVGIKEIDGKWGDFGRRGRHVQREEGSVGWGFLAMSQFVVGEYYVKFPI